ncbi:Trypanosomal VSG domain [Trypanosoma vivax]|nr:Trypanosomal VSG domain [Trypanosoma vivax]
MLCCLLSFALILAAARLGRGAGENNAEFRAACAIATQAQDIVEEPTPEAKGTLAKLLEAAEGMKREDIAAALAKVAVTNVTGVASVVTDEERKNATLLAAKMLEAGTWDTSATLGTQWHSPCKPHGNGNRSRRSWPGQKKQPTRDCTLSAQTRQKM